MQHNEILKAALNAFNEIPNKKLHGNKFKDTYQIASAIEKLLKQPEVIKVQEAPALIILCYTIKTEKQRPGRRTIETFTDHFEVFIETGEYDETPEQLARQRLQELQQTEDEFFELYTWDICKIVESSEAYI